MSKHKRVMRGANMSRVHWRALKQRVGGVCVYCNTRAPLTRDHIKPKARGGGNRRSNIIPACVGCNQAKADRPWRDFMHSAGLGARIRVVETFILAIAVIPKTG